jgi:hypothetical protein
LLFFYGEPPRRSRTMRRRATKPTSAEGRPWKRRQRGGSPNVFIDIGRAFCILGVKNLAILAQIDFRQNDI